MTTDVMSENMAIDNEKPVEISLEVTDKSYVTPIASSDKRFKPAYSRDDFQHIFDLYLNKSEKKLINEIYSHNDSFIKKYNGNVAMPIFQSQRWFLSGPLYQLHEYGPVMLTSEKGRKPIQPKAKTIDLYNVVHEDLSDLASERSFEVSMRLIEDIIGNGSLTEKGITPTYDNSYDEGKGYCRTVVFKELDKGFVKKPIWLSNKKGLAEPASYYPVLHMVDKKFMKQLLPKGYQW